MAPRPLVIIHQKLVSRVCFVLFRSSVSVSKLQNICLVALNPFKKKKGREIVVSVLQISQHASEAR